MVKANFNTCTFPIQSAFKCKKSLQMETYIYKWLRNIHFIFFHKKLLRMLCTCNKVSAIEQSPILVSLSPEITDKNWFLLDHIF